VPAPPDDLSAALPTAGNDAATNLLDAGAAATLFTRAGAKPRSGIALPEVCPADRWPECSNRAADILAQILTGSSEELLREWLVLAAAAARRAPHRLLTKLLDAAAARRALQPAVCAVIDERGRWLMQFNPRWQFASPTTDEPEQVWQLGNRPQRAAALREVRETNPALAREMIAATWQGDGADERVDWVACLAVGLSDEDEAFLETCLDDRSSRVREAAAGLLARLPDSKFVGRMIERVTPLLTYAPGAAGKLLKLKRPTKPSLEVTLPAEFDKAWQRDGVSEKPTAKIGQKQWWLQQLLGCVPLEHWTRAFGAPAVDIVQAAPEDFGAMLREAWLTSYARRPVDDWTAPLVCGSQSTVGWDPELLRAVPAQQRGAVLESLLNRAAQQGYALLARLVQTWRPFDESVSSRLLDAYDAATIVACELPLHVDLATLVDLEKKLVAAGDAPELRRRLDQALSVIALRRDMHRELTR
jgi:hypothetical protein